MKIKNVLMLIGCAALTIAGFIIIPKLIKKYSRKVYKKSLEDEEIDFDDMGPEIIPNENE